MSNVDLTSKEWCDLVFEGKNKDYGAYVLRRTSENRHTKSVIYTLIGAVLLGALVWGVATVQHMIEEASLKDKQSQSTVTLDMTQEEKKEEEQQKQKIEEKKPEPIEEKVAQQAVTELAIKPDAEVTKPPKSTDELKEDNTTIGQINQEGLKDNKLDLKPVEKVEDKVAITPVEEKKPVEDNQVFKSVEQMPSYPGGDAALLQDVANNLQYPAMAQENGTQGKVVLQFVVTKNGSIGEVKVVRSLSPECDQAAVKAVKKLKKFNPGRQNGNAVNVWYTLPVTFKLQT